MTAARVAGALLAALVLTACTGGGEPSAEPTSSPTPTAPASAVPPPAAPENGACYLLDHDDALEATNADTPVGCSSRHTAVTFHVGAVDAVVDGHLLAVDSERVQGQVAATCPKKLASYVGGTDDQRRLSMLRSVWFTPSLADSDAGAQWFRCDVVALAAEGELAPLAGRMRGVLDEASGRDRYGMCGTAEPGTPRFARIICSRDHSWRAIDVVPLPGSAYPGKAKARDAGQTPCQDAGAAHADEPLDYEWGYEWPTRAQWDAGQHYGLCWAPD